jgi:hypothetical protein
MGRCHVAQVRPTCQVCGAHMGEVDQCGAVTWHMRVEVAQLGVVTWLSSLSPLILYVSACDLLFAPCSVTQTSL